MAASPRRVAAELLLRIGRDGGYSGLVLDNALEQVPDADKALVTRLVYGVTERRLTLDHVIAGHSTVKLSRLHPVVWELLRLGVYQLLYMDRIPASAAVNETVKTARAMKQERAAGFVNAVLRAVGRKRARFPSTEAMLEDSLPPGDEGLAVRTSCPVELIRLWKRVYGAAMAEKLAAASLEPPPVALRVNTLVMDEETFEKRLADTGIMGDRHPALPGCYILKPGNVVKNLANLPENCYYLQDTASQWCCRAMEPRPGDRLADVCAAPGGKSLTCAGWMAGQGRILAADIHPGKCDALAERARRMGVTMLEAVAHDGTVEWPMPLQGTFDRVLCDVPCSGLGVIRRKPEIRYKPLESFRGLPETQLAVLSRAAALVKPGGWLQYSTCTLNPAENEDVAAAFLEQHPGFRPRTLPLDACFAVAGQAPGHQITLLPPVQGTDGFYIAGFERCLP